MSFITNRLVPQTTETAQCRINVGLLVASCRGGYIAAGPRQHSHSWFRVPSGPVTIFLLISGHLCVLKCGLLLDERKGLTATVSHSWMNSLSLIGLLIFMTIGSVIQLILRLLSQQFERLPCWYYSGEGYMRYAIEMT
jgi:hypothetical protein